MYTFKQRILFALVLQLVCLHQAFSEAITSCLRKQTLPPPLKKCYRFQMECDANQFIHIRSLHFNVVTRQVPLRGQDCCTNEVECLDEYSKQDMYDVYAKCSGQTECEGLTQISSLKRLANPDMKCDDEKENHTPEHLFVASTTMQYDCIEASNVVDMCSNVQKTVRGNSSVLHLMYRHGKGSNNYAPSSCTCLFNSQDNHRGADVMITEEDVRLHRYSSESGPATCSSAVVSIYGQQSSKSTKCAGEEPIDSFQTRHVISNPIDTLEIRLANIFHVGDEDEPDIVWLSVRIENDSTGQVTCAVAGPESPDRIVADPSGGEPSAGVPVYVIVIIVLGLVILVIGIVVVVIRMRRVPKQESNSSTAADNAGLDDREYSSDISEYAEIPRHPSLYTTIQEVSDVKHDNMDYETASPISDGIRGHAAIDRGYELVDNNGPGEDDGVNKSENGIKLPLRDMYAHVNKAKKKATSTDDEYNKLNNRRNEHKIAETSVDADNSTSDCYNALDSAPDQYNKINFKSPPRYTDPTYSKTNERISAETCEDTNNSNEDSYSALDSTADQYNKIDFKPLPKYSDPTYNHVLVSDNKGSLVNSNETTRPAVVSAHKHGDICVGEKIDTEHDSLGDTKLPPRAGAPASSDYEQPNL